MITTQDKELLAKKGITEAQIAEQLACLQTGFPFLKLDAAASIEKGILAPDAEEQKAYGARRSNSSFEWARASLQGAHQVQIGRASCRERV